MSRCFPYPPPGYTLSRASNEALIESIKLQKEREKAKAEKKKEKRREKDEKKKLKKEKAKPKAAEYDLCGGKSWGSSKDCILQKERKDEAEQLERSGITEEHELAQNNPSYSSDSTQNSNKRKRHASTSDGTQAQGTLSALDGTIHVQVAASALKGNRAQGNILRIRLPSQKSIKCDISGEQVSTTPIRREIPDKIAYRTEQKKTCSAASVATPPSTTQTLPPRPLNELRPSQIPLTSHENIRSSGAHVSKEFKKKQRVLQKYTDLLENFVPPIPQSPSFDADDQDWLFGLKHKKEPMKLDRTGTVGCQISCSSSCSMWPMARHIPEVDIYALPYTIPF